MDYKRRFHAEENRSKVTARAFHHSYGLDVWKIAKSRLVGRAVREGGWLGDDPSPAARRGSIRRHSG
jgi:hypothetical protein